MPQDFKVSPRDQFLMTAGAGMLNTPYSTAPPGMSGIGPAMESGLNVFQQALLLEEEEKERQRQQAAVHQFTANLNPNTPPQTRALANLLAQSPQGQQQLPGLLHPKPTKFGTPGYEDFVQTAMADLDLPADDPAVLDLASQRFMAEKNRVKAPLVSMAPGDTEAQKRAAILRDERYRKAMDNASNSRSKMNDLDSLNQLLKGYDGGPGAKNILIPMQSMLAEFGMDPATFNFKTETGRLQAARALEQRMVLGFRSTAEGEGMPGHLSDRDVRFLESMPPGLSMTERGRDLMYRLYRKRYQNSIDLGKWWTNQTAQNNGMPPEDIFMREQGFMQNQDFLVDENGHLTDFGKEFAEAAKIPDAGAIAGQQAPGEDWEPLSNPQTGEKIWFNSKTGEQRPRG